MPAPIERPQLGSFAIDPGQFAQSAAPNALGPVITPGSSITGSLNLIQNVPGARGGGEREASATMDAIFKLGGAAIQPYIEQEAQAQFMSGVRKAMEGQALKEIVDEQPWYTQIFGPANAAEGARFYTAQTRIAQFQGDLQSKMPEFAEQGPEALQQYALDALKAAKTGDPTADAIITKEYLTSLAPAFKQQAKESYILQQNVANAEQTEFYTKKIAALDLQFRRPAKDSAEEADRDNQFNNFVAALTPVDGQRSASHENNLYNAVLTSAANGNVSLLGKLKQSGILATLPADKQDTVQRALVQGSIIALNREAPKYAIDKATIEAGQADGVQAFVERRAALNARFAKETGITEVELLPSATMDNSIRSIIEYNERARADLQAKLGKDAAKMVEQNIAIQAVRNGGLAAAIANGETTSQMGQQALTMEIAAAAQQPEVQGQIAARNPGVESAVVKEVFATFNSQPEHNSGFERAYRIYSGLKTNEQAVNQYLSKPQARQMEHYDDLIRSGTQPADAYQMALRVPMRYDPELAVDPSGKREQLLIEAADAIGRDRSWYNPFGFGSTPLDESSTRMLARAGAKAFAFGGDPERNAKSAIMDAQKLGFQKYGTRGVLGLDPANPNLYQMLKRDTREVDTAFDAVIKTTADRLGIEDMKDYTIIRMPDAQGKARFMLSGSKDDGARYTINFTSDDISRKIDEARTSRAAPAATTPFNAVVP